MLGVTQLRPGAGDQGTSRHGASLEVVLVDARSLVSFHQTPEDNQR